MNLVKRKIAVAFGVMSMAAAGLVGSVSTAGAAPAGDVGIQAAKFHVFKHDNFKGAHASLSKTDKDLRNNTWAGGTVHNGTSSVQNQTTKTVVLWDRPGSCSGAKYNSKPKSEDKDLSNNGFDNKASCAIFK
ncbi:peptidase inhibitor family I36 protein [Streptomyces sp. E11-3]|uniref:peptidase inhibitor family I36 protein n=1 Tax=Streptomyces sp. E11-3 TaxID=3110112 RepID=UPI00397FF35F